MKLFVISLDPGGSFGLIIAEKISELGFILEKTWIWQKLNKIKLILCEN